MNRLRALAMAGAAGLLLAVSGIAQEKPKPAEQAKPVTPLRVQIVLSEFDGEKRVSSNPYTMLVNADEVKGPRESMIRMGLRVPVKAGTKESEWTYMDVGTNLDCWAEKMEDGRFKLSLGVERSSLYSPGPDRGAPETDPSAQFRRAVPILQRFNARLVLLVREGETAEAVAATDPVSGRMLKIDVTARVVK